MNAALLKRPSAFVPVAMSVAALSIVLGYAVLFGVAREADALAVTGRTTADPSLRLRMTNQMQMDNLSSGRADNCEMRHRGVAFEFGTDGG